MKSLPELVREDGSGYLSVDYLGLVPVLIEAIKEHQQYNRVLDARLADLERRMDQKR